ncbi:MAG: lysophospholipid acyltransferase family protein [Candidatus Omnitrophota bacterium]
MNCRPTLAGKFIYHCVPVRRKVVLENLRLVFADHLSPEAITGLAQCFYGHLLKVVLENLTTGWMSTEAVRKRVRVIGAETVIKAAEANKGVLLLAGHFGNWELAAIGAIERFEVFKGRFHAVRKLLANKFVERFFFRRFYEAGLNVIPKKNSLSLVLNALAKNDAVVFIMDQYARPDRDGILVDFFGRPAGTFKSLALIAGQSGAPVIPMASHREPDGTHVMRFGAPIPWIENPDPDMEIFENTRAYNRALEKMVLEHPEQWFWVHRRWKVK